MTAVGFPRLRARQNDQHDRGFAHLQLVRRSTEVAERCVGHACSAFYPTRGDALLKSRNRRIMMSNEIGKTRPTIQDGSPTEIARRILTPPRCLLLVLILFATLGLCQAKAQNQEAAQQPLSKASVPSASEPSVSDLQDLVNSLKDSAKRQELVDQIEALIAVKQGGTQSAPKARVDVTNTAPDNDTPAVTAGAGEELIGFLSRGANYIGDAVASMTTAPPFGRLAEWKRKVITDPPLRISLTKGAVLIILSLAIALAARQVMLLAVGRVRRRTFQTALGPIWNKLVKGAGLVLLGWIPILVFLAIGYVALAIGATLPGSPALARALALDLMDAIALVHAIGVLANVPLQSAADGTRFIDLDEETAEYWMVWISRLSRFLIYIGFATEFARQLGMPRPQYEIILKLLGLVFVGLVVMLVLQNRKRVARVIQGHRESGGGFAQLRAQIGEIWHILAILYIVGVYGVWAADISGSFSFLVRASILTILIVMAARFLVIAGTTLLRRFLAVSPRLGERLPGLQTRVNLYAPMIINVGRAFLYLIAMLLVLQAWGLGALALLATPLGERAIGSTAATAVTAVFAVVVWEAVSLAIELYLARPGLSAAGLSADASALARSARVRTVLPLFRKALAIVLGLVVGLIGLSEFGVNIGPLLAGAGIAGIAVGFGAQSLVKDVITGIFVLMQDAVSVGDVVDVGGGNSGFVEQITIRSIRMRDQSGTVIIVPFSEVSTVKNMTKDFSFALFEIGIAYREDVDYVIEVVTTLSEELRREEDFSWRITAPIEILGLDRFADSAVIIKARIKTRPIQQWTVMREFNRRMKRRFDDLGIEIPFPHQTIYFGADRAGQAPPVHIAVQRTSNFAKGS